MSVFGTVGGAAPLQTLQLALRCRAWGVAVHLQCVREGQSQSHFPHLSGVAFGFGLALSEMSNFCGPRAESPGIIPLVPELDWLATSASSPGAMSVFLALLSLLPAPPAADAVGGLSGGVVFVPSPFGFSRASRRRAMSMLD